MRLKKERKKDAKQMRKKKAPGEIRKPLNIKEEVFFKVKESTAKRSPTVNKNGGGGGRNLILDS